MARHRDGHVSGRLGVEDDGQVQRRTCFGHVDGRRQVGGGESGGVVVGGRAVDLLVVQGVPGIVGGGVVDGNGDVPVLVAIVDVVVDPGDRHALGDVPVGGGERERGRRDRGFGGVAGCHVEHDVSGRSGVQDHGERTRCAGLRNDDRAACRSEARRCRRYGKVGVVEGAVRAVAGHVAVRLTCRREWFLGGGRVEVDGPMEVAAHVDVAGYVSGYAAGATFVRARHIGNDRCAHEGAVGRAVSDQVGVVRATGVLHLSGDHGGAGAAGEVDGPVEAPDAVDDAVAHHGVRAEVHLAATTEDRHPLGVAYRVELGHDAVSVEQACDLDVRKCRVGLPVATGSLVARVTRLSDDVDVVVHVDGEAVDHVLLA